MLKLTKSSGSNLRKREAIVFVCAAIFGLVAFEPVWAASSTGSVSLEVNVMEVISLDCGSDTVNLGTVTPGVPVTGSSDCIVSTNSDGGYSLTVKKDSINDATLYRDSDDSIKIADKDSWDPNGEGNAHTWSGTGLGFTVYDSTATKNISWWGTGRAVNDSHNKYAGFTPNQTDIMRHLAYSEVPTVTRIGYKLDIPISQKSGAYSGSITYEAIMNP